MLKNLQDKTPEKLKEPFWKDYISKAYTNTLKSIKDGIFVPKTASSWLMLLTEIKSTEEEISWYPILVNMSIIQSKSEYILTPFKIAMSNAINEDKDNFKKLIYRTDIKSYPRDLRQSLYNDVISQGKLDVKIARRIRSDSSGAMSKACLQTLFECKAKYKDEDFQDLITQFSDTKHRWVAQYIALNMPLHLTPFLIGLDDKTALKIIEKRMDNIED